MCHTTISISTNVVCYFKTTLEYLLLSMTPSVGMVRPGAMVGPRARAMGCLRALETCHMYI